MKNLTFGIEIETTGLGREGAANAIASYFGTHAIYLGTHLSNWEVPMPDGRHWTVERDGSVTDPSAECVSPVCTWDEIAMVQDVVRALRGAGAFADGSCGIHVHVGLDGFTPKTLRNLVNIVNAKEDLLTDALGITGQRRINWCKPVEPAFLDELNRVKPQTMEDFARIWYTCNPDPYNPSASIEERRNRHYDRSRYHLLNLHAAFSTERPAHTIEFRAFNGTMHAGKIKAYIQLCLAICAQARASKSASPTRPVTSNPRYTFRCWLLRLGFIGDEFATAREHLTKNLLGDSAWRDPNHR